MSKLCTVRDEIKWNLVNRSIEIREKRESLKEKQKEVQLTEATYKQDGY